MIGHTQPRRIAARAVAERIAEELGQRARRRRRLQGAVQRPGERRDTLVKVMTDGILLAEMQSDRDLLAYDTIIIDEAHERSLNIDFLLGYLKQLLPRRPDLKVIITSATIDPSASRGTSTTRRSSRSPAGRIPVEVRYRPLVESPRKTTRRRGTRAARPDDGDRRRGRGAVHEGPGDILVFLSGEREIRDTADALRKAGPAATPRSCRSTRGSRRPSSTGSSSSHTGPPRRAGHQRRRDVADGARHPLRRRPRHRAHLPLQPRGTKVQRLPIEPVSQASANQRKGRCGRVAAGICIRLYSEDDFDVAARSSPTPRSCARTSPRSSCR